MKKFISILLAVIISVSVFSIVPFSVSAAETNESAASAESGSDKLAAQPDEEEIGDSNTGTATWALDDNGTLTIGGSGTIRSWGFDSMSPAVKKIVIQNGITVIGEFTFANCKSVTEVVIADSVTEIQKNAFDGCTALSELTIPNSVTTIGSDAFINCDSLASVTIPKSVTNAESGFRECDSLKTVIFEDGMETIPAGILYQSFSVENIIIPDSVTEIKENAFSNCTSLSQITIPESVTRINYFAFRNCDSLTSLTLPKNLAFGGTICPMCDNLKTIIFEDGMTTIPADVLYDTDSVENVIIPDSVTEIGVEAFGYCTSLSQIYIPESVTKIGDYAFRSCTDLSGINIPKGTTVIGDYAFWGCTSLTSVTIPKNVIRAYKSFEECSGIKSVVFENGIQKIPDYILSGVQGVENITVPQSVTSIGVYAFECCVSLKAFIIPENVTEIGECAFNNCSSLISITIPKNVKSAYKAFYYNFGIKNIIFEEGIKSIPQNVLYEARGVETVTIPSSVTKIEDYAFYNCNSLKEITIPENLKTIGEFSFYECRSLKEITIPQGVTSIGVSAFDNCRSLRKVNIPDNITKINESAFKSCWSLKEVEIPNSVTRIEQNAFKNCTLLKKITIPQSVTYIGQDVFSECINLIAYGYKNSTAQTYAAENNIRFIEISTYEPECGIRTTFLLPDTYNWGTAYIYAWDSEYDYLCGEWPGKLQADTIVNEYGQIMFVCKVPEGAAGVFVSDGNNMQTAEITDFSNCEDYHYYMIGTKNDLGFYNVEKASHNVVNDSGYAPTCTKTGLTSGTHCSVCGEVITAQEVIPATGHIEVINAGYAPTCTETGLTEGVNCAVCGEVITVQEVIPATGHTVVTDAGYAPTCTETGLTKGLHCSVCGEVISAQAVIPATGHHGVVVPGVPATTTTTGLTDGEKCDICGEWIVEQQVIPAIKQDIIKGVYYENGVAKNAGLVRIGNDFYYTTSGGKIVYGDQTIYGSRTNGLLPGGVTYHFDETTGKLYKDNVIIDDVYYKEGAPKNVGIVKVAGAYYVTTTKGVITKDAYNKYIASSRTNGLVAIGYYDFGPDGKMILRNGIIGGKYYVNGKATNVGLFEYEADGVTNIYCTTTGGVIIKDVTNKFIASSRTNGLAKAGYYSFDSEGRMIK